MKFLTPNTLKQFLYEFNKYNNSGDHYFRGQADSKWSIIPGLGRNKCKKIYNEITKIEAIFYKKFKEKIIEKEISHFIPLIKNSYHESWQWLMAAQHYGLPTRLLDFSHDKYTALEFAVCDLGSLDTNGALIIYHNVNSIHEEVTSTILISEFKLIDKTFFFQVPQFVQNTHNECNLSERRKAIQGSKFLYRETNKIRECLALDNYHSPSLTKIHISKNLKIQIIEYLFKNDRLASDIYAGKNAIDYYSAILKNDFMNLDSNNLNIFFGNKASSQYKSNETL